MIWSEMRQVGTVPESLLVEMDSIEYCAAFNNTGIGTKHSWNFSKQALYGDTYN